MRAYPKALQGKVNSLEDSMSWLATVLESTVNWGQIPNHEIKILKERIKTMSDALDDIYSRVTKYENPAA